MFYTSNNLPFAILDLSSMRIQRWFRQHLLRRQYLRKRSGLYGLMHTERRKRDSGYDCSFYLLVSICVDRECPIVSNYVLQLLTSNTFGIIIFLSIYFIRNWERSRSKRHGGGHFVVIYLYGWLNKNIVCVCFKPSFVQFSTRSVFSESDQPPLLFNLSIDQ